MLEPNYSASSTSPADFSWSVVPDDDADLVRVTREVTAVTGGTVAWVNMAGDPQVTTFFDEDRRPIRARRILASGTTATGLEAIA